MTENAAVQLMTAISTREDSSSCRMRGTSLGQENTWKPRFSREVANSWPSIRFESANKTLIEPSEGALSFVITYQRERISTTTSAANLFGAQRDFSDLRTSD
jgi:hypothetical protein